MAEELDLPVGKEAVDRLIRENSDLFSDERCNVCSAVLISESQKLAHYQSKKHASKYSRYLSNQQGGFSVAPAKKRAEPAPDVNDETDRNKRCPVCNMTFSSPVVAASHYEGKIHAKKLRMKSLGVAAEETPLAKKARLAPPTPAIKNADKTEQPESDKCCKLCNATFNNPQMAEQHYAGKKHKKQETKSKLMTIYTSSGIGIPQTTPLKPLTPGSASKNQSFEEKKKEKAGDGFTCKTCKIVVNSIAQYEAHITGVKHKSKTAAEAKNNPSIPEQPDADPNADPDADPELLDDDMAD